MYLNSESCQIYLRLSYNAFIGTAPAELSNPTNPELKCDDESVSAKWQDTEKRFHDEELRIQALERSLATDERIFSA
eukprot:scaffold1442_cov212-Alexandrium_tamarense.AAC.13